MTKAEVIKWLSILVDDCTHNDWTDEDVHGAEKAQAIEIAIQILERSEDNGEA